MRLMRHAAPVLTALLLAPTWAAAQLGNEWVTFSKQSGHLSVHALPDVGHPTISDNDTQVVFRTGDLNRDGWPDVVAVRKQQASQTGKRTAVLLMNVNGVLTDKTALYASASDAGSGDQGFLTPCNNREVAIGDVNNDGWPDLVTAASLSDGDPKFISHPRVYMNLGKDLAGNWLGLRYEESRFPQLLTFGAGAHAVAPRFCGMALGDVTGDGFSDLYFVDYDETETGIGENPADDLNDRFLRNDGNGYFIDESQARFTATQLGSAFGADAAMHDINKDGKLDIIKDSTLGSPRVVWGLYNNAANVGVFSAMGTPDLGDMPAPYGMELGDLNRDAFTDIVIVDDGSDIYRLGTGTTGGPLNYATWALKKNFAFIPGAGGDAGFGHTPYIRDLDGDGWNDVLVTDVDGDLTGCDRRLSIYHNRGTVPGDMNLVLQEESELASGNYGAGWKGVKGMLQSDLRGTYDVGFGDFDHDGDLDLLLGVCAGTSYWQNETNPTYCQADLGFAGPGSGTLSVCGGAPLAKGYTATLKITGAVPSSMAYICVGLSNNPTPLKGGMLVTVPLLTVVAVPTTGAGTVTIPGVKGGAGPFSVYLQALIADGAQEQGFAFTNAVRIDLLANP